MSTDADVRVAAYAEWVRRLRQGYVVPEISVDGDDVLARLGYELDLLAKTLVRREVELQRLFDITHAVGQGITLEKVLDRIFERFAGLIPYDRISCAFLSDDGARLTSYWARSNLPTLEIGPGYAQPMAGSSLETILRTGQPRIINDLKAHLADHPNSASTNKILREGGRSSLTCPLIADRPIGFLFFTSRHENTYREMHQTVFCQIAGQVSIIIEKGRIYQNILDCNRRLADAAARDALTGLLNRGGIAASLERALSQSAARGGHLGVILADIDHFKQINDSLGHSAGDEALREFADRLSTAVRPGDTIGRYGGEEFLIVLTDANVEMLRNAAERLRQTVAGTPFVIGGAPRTVTASFGTAVAPAGASDAKALVDSADTALYVAKNQGRNRVAVA